MLTARVVVLVLWFLQPLMPFSQSLAFRSVASREETIAVEVCPPDFVTEVIRIGTFLVFGAEVRSENLELLQEVRIGIHWCIAVTSRIGDVRTVGHDVQRVRPARCRRSCCSADLASPASPLALIPMFGQCSWTCSRTGIDAEPGLILMYSAALLLTCVKFCNSFVVERERFFAGVDGRDREVRGSAVTSTVCV